jgi:hypothetical protein
MTNQRADVRTLLDYEAAFNTLEVRAILPYFHEPSLLMGPQGAFAAPADATPEQSSQNADTTTKANSRAADR